MKNYSFFLALKFLRSKKSNGFLSFITFISVAGIALGVASLLVVIGVMTGFEQDLKKKILGSNAHAMVMKYGSSFKDYHEIEEKVLKDKRVKISSPFIMSESMISSNEDLAGIMLKGLPEDKIAEITDLKGNIIRGSFNYTDKRNKEKAKEESDFFSEFLKEESEKFPEDENLKNAFVLIGKELANTLDVDVGDEIILISPVGKISLAGYVPRTMRAEIAGIFRVGMYEYDSKFVYAPIEKVQSFLKMEGSVTGIEIKFDNFLEAKKITDEWKNSFIHFPFRVKSWEDYNRNLFNAMKLEKIAMGIILLFIVLVASFNIISTLVMTVTEKKQDIALLKSLGAENSAIMKVFFFQGIIIGTTGTIIGLFSGLGLCALIDRFGYKLNPDVYYLDKLPVILNPEDVLMILFGSLLITFFAGLYPSRKATQISPAAGFRYE